MISTACKIEFIPAGGTAIVLADVGGWMDALPRMSAQQQLHEPDGIGLSDGYIRPLAGVVVDITFSTVTEPSTAEEMWGTYLDSLPPAATGALVLTGGGQVTTFAPAVLMMTVPALPGPDAVVIKRYHVQAALPVTESI